MAGRSWGRPDLWAMATLGCVAGLMAYRAHLVDAAYGSYTGCRHCFAGSVFGNDVLLLAGLVALVGLSRATRNLPARAVLACVATFGILAYAIDVVIFRLLAHRLLVSDALKFAPDAVLLLTVVRPLLETAEGWIGSLAILGALASAPAAILGGPAHARRAAQWLLACVALIGAGYAIPQANYLHNFALRNLWQINAELDEGRPYSAAFWNRSQAVPALALRCEAGLATRVSVVLVIVESLSAYHSALFSGLNDYTPKIDRLSFGDHGSWLRAIGIDETEGAEHPFYRGMPRGQFGAASDAALVDRFLQWHASRRADVPFMATIVTLGTHPPYVASAGGDEATRFHEADIAVARLADTLEARGFFANGVMVIVGDHRAMTPIPPGEYERLGSSAEARIVAIALGHSGLVPGEERRNLQQLDLIPSLRHMIDRSSCRDEWHGRFLGGDAQPARYVVRTDPMHRNQMVVIGAEGEYRLLLDGDDTRWITAPPGEEDAKRVLGEINRQRMARMAEFRRGAAH